MDGSVSTELRIIFMAISTSYTEIRGIGVHIEFNETNAAGEYIPITVYAHGQAVTPEGAHLNLRTSKEFGVPDTAPKTPKELYNMMPSQLQGVLKDLYLAGIGDDIAV